MSDFIYEHSKNLVVEISRGDIPYADTTQFRLMASKRAIGNYRSMHGHRDSTRWMNPGRDSQLDIGFDINPTAVSGIRNIQASGLFPNPSTDGYFMLTMETKQAIKSLSLDILDVTGRVVLSKQYGSVSTEFAREIDARQLSKGMYLLRIEADGETMTKKLLLQ
ncbi:MAG: T9SS type A sorting domain-containing protein [Bacteroidetes bacterium]|nr:T9SS type A sorting domain-containing protein [Bacteroidota bacterium]